MANPGTDIMSTSAVATSIQAVSPASITVEAWQTAGNSTNIAQSIFMLVRTALSNLESTEISFNSQEIICSLCAPQGEALKSYFALYGHTRAKQTHFRERKIQLAFKKTILRFFK
ncbi:MAG: hypothetical protein ABUS47_03790 [Steroidobacter sp.]